LDGSLYHAPYIEVGAIEHELKEQLLIHLLQQEPVALYAIVLRRVGSIEDRSQLQLLILFIDGSCLMDTEVIKEEHNPLIWEPAPELLQELHIALLIE
jgi:hypothetical protein